MRYLSICSGIEAVSVAWEPLGWKPLAFAEIEPFPRAVLKHRYPDVPLHGGFTKLRDEPWIADADVLVGGTPCQGFSVAGSRGSLSDDRSNLALEFVRLANAVDNLRRDDGREPAFILWENVPGIFSTGDNAFGAFLAGLVGSDAPINPARGGGWTDAGVVAGPCRVAAWRCLDAQFHGLAQRRKRVFVLARGHPGGWACADALLPVIDSLSWHPAPRREAGKDVARSLTGGSGKRGWSGDNGAGQGCELVTAETAPSLTASGRGVERVGESRGQDPVVACFGGNNTAGSLDVATAVNAHGGSQSRGDCASETFVTHSLRREGFDASEDGTVGSLTVGCRKLGQGYPAGFNGTAVRRLTPRECERLQGFPDEFTRIPWRGRSAEECPDGPRYKALGNSMAVPVMAWIGGRIEAVQRALFCGAVHGRRE